MEHVLVLNSRSVAAGKDSLKTCCRPNCHTRRVKNKGALLVLVWNFPLMSLFYYLTMYAPREHLYFVIWGLSLPIAGWIADMYCGRYRVIHWSMWIMWTAGVLTTTSSIIASYMDSYASINETVMQILLAMIAIGFGGYQANAIQFGIDQLHDASTNEIKSFISWYVWTYMSGGIAVDYIYTCTNKKYYELIGMLLICICLTIVLSTSLCLDYILVKEPATQNPFKVVYKVIRYAIKHKHPACRSAFTYHEDDIPSRLDLGKAKYGGPFTTEQVEDVKTFLRLLSAVLFGCAMVSGHLVVNELRDQFYKMLMYHHQMHTPTTQCYLNMTYTKTAFYVAAVLIPISEFLIQPFFHNYFSWVESYWKFAVGVVLQMARVLTLMAYVITARYNYHKYNRSNSIIQCIYSEDYGALASSFDIRLMILPSFLNSISIALLGIGGVEFICAQTPYSMRGLISGAGYGSVAIFTLIGFGITQPFRMPLPAWSSTGTIISCGFWYLLMMIVHLAFNSIVLYILKKLYKNRKREDVLPNEQIFAERYYSTLTPSLSD